MNPDPSNSIFQTAVAFVNQTNKHLFLTGKAGTGKTTFLKYIKENTFKKMAIVAPTGVAAINAGGVTIHSFFQLPLGPFIPGDKNYWASYNGELNTPSTLIKNLRLTTARRDVIRELDLLVIDEVSMVRADLLDAMDTVLRYVRRQPLRPFGGVQMVYIGDLFQLPPVVKNEEWVLLNEFYSSPFFFHAEAIKNAFPLYIELKKIYRQKDDSFIHILNNIRNNCCTPDDLDYLHQYYKPGYVPAKGENYITLTSHNGKADELNQSQLHRLDNPLHTFEARVTGEFHERMYPAEKTLLLKVGSQVMFIKNDKGDTRRFYNGKIATITKVESDNVYVQFAGETQDLQLERETWKNIRYKYQQDQDEVDEEELGTFTQFPIRLAWAITIHKSQGLTFEKAIIDAGASFSPGQVYVSLSRLTSLQGLILYSRILPHTISTDQRVIDFVKNEVGEEQLQLTLEEEQKTFIRHTLLQNFNWQKLLDNTAAHYDTYEHRKIPEQAKCTEWAMGLLEVVRQQSDVAAKFYKLLEHLFLTCEADKYQQVKARTTAAANYFINEIETNLLSDLQKHVAFVSTQPKVKKYLKELESLKTVFEQKKQQLSHALKLAETMAESPGLSEVLQLTNKPASPVIKLKTPATGKAEKGDTQRKTLQLFKQGKGITDIATERNLAVSTVEGHLCKFIATGEVDVTDLVDSKKMDDILETIRAIEKEDNAANTELNEAAKLTAAIVKPRLSDDYTWGEIRAVLAYADWRKSETKQHIDSTI